MLTRNIYSFRIAYFDEDQVREVSENTNFDPTDLTLTILSNGQPSYKTIHVPAFSHEEAIRKAEDYVSKTTYKEIPNNKTI